MAWGDGGTLGSGQSKTAATTIALTTSAVAEAGSVVMVVVAIDNTATADAETSEVSSISDSAGGNTWVKVKEWCNAQGGANAGATASLWYSKLTNQIASGGTITANLANSITAKAITAWKFTFGAGSTISVANSLTQSVDGADPGLMTIFNLPDGEHLQVRGIAGEDKDTTQITPTSGYTAFSANQTSGGGAAANMGVRGEWRISTVSSPESDPTWVNCDNASVYVALKETAASLTVAQQAGLLQPASLDEQLTDDPRSFIQALCDRVAAAHRVVRLAST